MSVTVITEDEFHQRVANLPAELLHWKDWTPWAVTGPGRSGAVASVYVSHALKIPMIPFGTKLPKKCQRLLVVDTALMTGKTMRQALKKYKEHDPRAYWFFNEPPRVRFWYEMEVSDEDFIRS